MHASNGKTFNTFVMGDIHGAYRALRQCLERANFDYKKDHLIFLGDVADGWPDTKACIDELLKIKHLTFILGNHDWWTREWMNTGIVEEIWLDQGGDKTIESYKGAVPDSHVKMLNHALPYFEIDGRLFVHAGFDIGLPLSSQHLNTFLWDRTLARVALDFYAKQIDKKLTSFDEVYLGHTPNGYERPIKSCDIWMMDTGAGWAGRLSMMNIDTKEVFTSDPTPLLYPGIEGRKRR